MADLTRLLSGGYFFSEIPPSFSSADFGLLVINNRAQLPQNNLGKVSKLTKHDLARAGIGRRQMAIPSPENYLYVSELISQHWAQLLQVAQRSPFSKSLPTVRQGGDRAIYPQFGFSDLIEFKAEIRSRSKYVLQTDVAKFYSSIYSHSIAWAMHGKAVAKANHGNQLIGNDFDRRVRNAQDGQTKGIPIGPDYSLLVSEIVLARVDEFFHNQWPSIVGYRYMDDYELGFQTYTDAEHGLALLQRALNEFELDINFAKTQIVGLPIQLDDDWKTELGYFAFRNNPIAQRTDIIRFFSLAFELSKKHPNTSVLKYAIRKLRSLELELANWPLLQNLLLQTLEVEFGSMPSVLEMLIDWNDDRFPLDFDAIGEVLNHCIVSNGNARLDSDVSWALWALINWGLQIRSESAEVILNLDDSIVSILALDAESRNLIQNGLNIDRWIQYASTEELSGDRWLLSYEGSVKGWIHSPNNVDYIAGDAFFLALRNNGVEFYQPNAPFRVFPPRYE